MVDNYHTHHNGEESCVEKIVWSLQFESIYVCFVGSGRGGFVLVKLRTSLTKSNRYPPKRNNKMFLI